MTRLPVSIVLPVSVIFLGIAADLPAANIPLKPQPDYPLLNISCGGVHTSTYVTAFDANGNIRGEVYAWTSCGLSGRGGGYQSQTYDSWHSIVWDLTGAALVTTAWDGVRPDPLFVAKDAHGNTIRTVEMQSANGAAYLGMLMTPQADSGNTAQSPAPGTVGSQAGSRTPASSTEMAATSPATTAGGTAGGSGGGSMDLWVLGMVGLAASVRVRRRLH